MENEQVATKPKRSGASAAALGAVLALALGVPAVMAVARPASPVQSAVAAEVSGSKLVAVEEIPYQTVIVEDEAGVRDAEVEEQAGVRGLRQVWLDPAVGDEPPTRRVVVVNEPVDRIVKVGTALALPAAEEPPAPEPEPEPQVDSAPAGASRSAAPPASSYATTGEWSLSSFMRAGVVMWGGHKFTYYSQSVLPGGGLRIPGRHVNGGGFVADGDGYIVLAAGYGIPKGSVFSTPFGASGKVYDTCGSCSPEWLDVYIR